MLTGRAPFADDDAVVVMARHIKDQPPPLGEIAPELELPPGLERVLRRSLEKVPSERPQSAEAFIALIDAAVEEAGSAASGVHLTSVPPPREEPRSRRTWPVVMVLALVALAAASLVLVRPSSTPKVAPAESRSLQKPQRGVNVRGVREAVDSHESTTTAVKNSAPQAALSADRSLLPTPEPSARPKRNVGKRAPASAVPKLERKSNERYGRFD